MILEIPLWLAIVIASALFLHFMYLLFSDFLVKLIHKKYNLELKDKEGEENDE